MDNGTIASMLSQATGSDFESTYLNVMSSRLREGFSRPPSERRVEMLHCPEENHVDVKEFMRIAKAHHVGDSSAMNVICRHTGRSLESVAIEANRTSVWSAGAGNVGGWTAPIGTFGIADASGKLAATGSLASALVDYRPTWSPGGNAGANSELLNVVRDTDKRESVRLKALQELIDNGAQDELYELVNDTDRRESWREKALNALIDMADHSSGAMECLNRLVNSDRCESWRSRALDKLCERAADGASDAADYLHGIVNNTDRCESWRHRALRALIRGGHRSELRRIADNTDRCSSWRREARAALGE